ncbi:hypothetical protein B9G54_01455 [Alloscardovia macacae]|uniref:Polyhydroxyalkanoate depolymerase n=1 Tax=Alloscardovia macacae TaxID=1160091 RepID=A0A1Y2SXH1_9BIFI|nr:nucleotidyltransferase family protein [Alloscardovia macacae]OTA27215.1 hypothetical protein B9G54_01455 [Alloscardovia macacae]OTA28452.1 hypothetical protein B9T39_06620 [Alloscardovia macacae]
MTTYYFSTLHGNDSSAGTHHDTPWSSLSQITGVSLQPGDAILLERGSDFTGQFLHLSGVAGTSDTPVIISEYGDPDLPLPRIDARGDGIWFENYGAPIGGAPHKYCGNVSTTLLLKDCSYVEVSLLDIANSGEPTDGRPYNAIEAMDRTGIALIAQDGGTMRHVHIDRVYVHDVEGNVYNKHMANGGIYAIAHFPSDPDMVLTNIARFDDIRITHCTVQRTRRWGIAVGYTAYLNYIDHGERDAATGEWTNVFDYGGGRMDHKTLQTYGATNVRIEENVVEDAGGDAITVMYCDTPYIRANVSRRAARDICDTVYTATQNDKVAAAIWPWRCKDALFEYNEAYDTLNADCGNGDGQAWDADFGDGTVYRYNYSSGNSGGTVMFCNEKAVNSQFYHNVAYHDHLGAIDIPRNPDAYIHHNVFILADDCEPLRTHRADGVARIEENIFVNDAQMPYDYLWHPDGSDITWSRNRFQGFISKPDEEGNYERR